MRPSAAPVFATLAFVIAVAPIPLAAQTSAVYSPPRPNRACPVSVTAQRIGGLASVQTGTPAPTLQDKQKLAGLRDRITALQQQGHALQQRSSGLQAQLAHNPDAATAADLHRQLADLDRQISINKAQLALTTAMFNQIDAAIERQSLSQLQSPSIGLDLDIASNSRHSIAAIDILVHGFSSAGQLLPASAQDSLAPQADIGPRLHLPANAPTQAFHLAPGHPGLFTQAFRSSIWTHGLMGIRWLEVTRVEFADGSVWLPAAGGDCRFTPSLYVPVDTSAPSR